MNGNIMGTSRISEMCDGIGPTGARFADSLQAYVAILTVGRFPAPVRKEDFYGK